MSKLPDNTFMYGTTINGWKGNKFGIKQGWCMGRLGGRKGKGEVM